jgi:hypothetical protein
MARFKDEGIIVAAFQPYLQPGEPLFHYAYGVKQPPFLLILVLMLLAVLPGIIATQLLTKEYVIGLTDRRLLVIRFSGKLVAKEVFDYPLHQLPPVRTSTGALFTHIAIRDPKRPFVAKFHRLGLRSNRDQSMAIAGALQARQLPGQVA